MLLSRSLARVLVRIIVVWLAFTATRSRQNHWRLQTSVRQTWAIKVNHSRWVTSFLAPVKECPCVEWWVSWHSDSHNINNCPTIFQAARNTVAYTHTLPIANFNGSMCERTLAHCLRVGDDCERNGLSLGGESLPPSPRDCRAQACLELRPQTVGRHRHTDTRWWYASSDGGVFEGASSPKW